MQDLCIQGQSSASSGEETLTESARGPVGHEDRCVVRKS
jgi:hypothetical protein